MDAINERVYALRKALKLNQKDFGKPIGLKQNTVSQIETSDYAVSDRNISLICEKFNVSEKWLREGEGNMFISDEEALVNRLKNELSLNDTEVSVLNIYVNSPEDARKSIMDFILRISKQLAEERAAAEAAARSMSLEEQEEAELAAVRAKYQALREGKPAPAKEHPPVPTQEELPLDPALEEEVAKFRARIYARDKKRRMSTISTDTESTLADENVNK